MIYADIDNFKAYNDVYGFDAGDEAILMTAEILTQTAGHAGGDAGFVGHVGGDDFVVVLPAETTDAFVAEATRRYDATAPTLYNDADRRAGGIRAKDRQGQPQFFPFLSLSLAGIPLAGRTFDHVGKVAAVAAELKKVAKRQKGSSFALDQRQG